MNISIIGGDLRIIRLAEMYARENNNVYVYGLEKYFENNSNYENIIECNNLDDVINKSKVIISSMPFSSDGKIVNSPFSKEKIYLSELKEKLSYKLFIAGGIPTDFTNGEFESIDLLQNEKLTILNAIPTVEGTIKITIEEREETIHESNILICGFGRIGKILCRKYKALGANVYCAARRDTDLSWIREERYIPLKYEEIYKYGKRFDILINTVPTTVITDKELSEFRKDILLIDIASKPGGIDLDSAQNNKLKTIVALGIPGKMMPKTAARYIKEVIDERKVIN